MNTIKKMCSKVQEIAKTYIYALDSEIVQHQNSLPGRTVDDAMKSIVNHLDCTGQGCCLYVVTKFLESFPEATYGFIPEENPFQENRRTSNKVIAIYKGKVFDIVAAVEKKKEPVTKFCNIPLAEYCNNNLLDDECMTILPNPQENLKEDFMDYFFHTANAISLSKREV